MNKLQEKQLEILLEIDRICKEHNIKYFLSSGTLIGAVRHNGFIPWDDDLDINMPIEDFWRFSDIAPKLLNKQFFYQSTDTDLWYRFYTKVRMNGTTMIETSYKNLAFHQGVWVDIFPVIGMENNPRAIKRTNTAIAISDLLLQDAFYENEASFSLKLKLLFKIPIRIRRVLCKAIRKSIMKGTKKCNYSDYYWGFPFGKPRFPSDQFDEIILHPFEGHMLPIPKRYDEILSYIYGDYMTPPPPEKRNSGHYIEILDLEKDYKFYINKNQ